MEWRERFWVGVGGAAVVLMVGYGIGIGQRRPGASDFVLGRDSVAGGSSFVLMW